MTRQQRRYPLIDPLRGLAAFWVVLLHTSILAGAANPHSALRPVLTRPLAFSVFFVLSGFLLYRPFVKARLSSEPRPELRPYLWRRVVRLLPAYWVALTVTALVLGLPGVFTREGIVAYYGLTQVYSDHTIGGGLPQAWTLCIEVAFYVAVPLWAAAMSRLPLRGGRSRLTAELVGVGGIVAASLAFKALAIALADPPGHLFRLPTGETTITFAPIMRTLPAYVDHLALGMALAAIAATVELGGRIPRVVERLRCTPGRTWSLAALVAVIATAYIGRTAPAEYSIRQFFVQHVLSGITAVLIVLPALAPPGRSRVARMLDVRPLRYLGTISYGVFLWHIGVLLVLSRVGWASVAKPAPLPLWLVPTFAGAVALGTLSWYGVERPTERLRGLVRTRRAGRPATAADAPNSEATAAAVR